jgi:hypothetical protein
MQSLLDKLPNPPQPLVAPASSSSYNPFPSLDSQIETKLDASKWDSSLVSLRLHRLLLSSAKEYLGGSFVISRAQFLAQHRETPTPDGLDALSASDLLSMLFFDADFTRIANISFKRLVGNALLWARWKERIEFLTVSTLPPAASSALLQQYDVPGGTDLFNQFSEGLLPEQKEGIQRNDAQALQKFLSVSPWSSMPEIVDAWKRAKDLGTASIIGDPILRKHWSDILNLPNLDTLQSMDRRRRENQYKIGALWQSLEGYNQNQAEQLVAYDAIMDIRLGANGLQAQAARMLMDPTLQAQVLAAVPRDKLSTAMADIIGMTGRNLLRRLVQNPTLQLTVALLLSYRAGLYLSAQTSVVRALSGLLYHLLLF